LAAGACVVGLFNLPHTGIFKHLPESWTLRFEHYVQPTGAYFPSADIFFRTPKFTLWIAVLSTLIAVTVIFLTYQWFWNGKGPHGLTERNKFARAGYRILENKYYFDWLYTDVIVGFVKGPLARATNWVNQNVIDGVVNQVGKSARVAGGFVYNRIDQGVVDTVVKGSGMAAEGSGSLLRRSQNGKVQWYAAYLFIGAAILAGFIIWIAS
jgi:NADH-quinone oxidoreductase subunit L